MSPILFDLEHKGVTEFVVKLFVILLSCTEEEVFSHQVRLEGRQWDPGNAAAGEDV